MADWYGLTEAQAEAGATHVGVGEDQLHHDYAISHVLRALSRHSDWFVFYGGTALSRTILDGCRPGLGYGRGGGPPSLTRP
ncbi:MAG: hypothetical protein LBI33_04260 [Propionibacteriaceae bacterium]|jgi:predicted nucleotidyltransferase component of viral defense system|nr:hypothetical protein [Propionibacteriaceae bacterium]